MTAPVHIETCTQCGGSGAVSRRGPGYIIRDTCDGCLGSGRVPVPMRGITDPDETDEREAELRDKLKFATDALQRIFDHGATVGCCSVCTDAAEAALNQLSKSASNPAGE